MKEILKICKGRLLPWLSEKEDKGEEEVTGAAEGKIQHNLVMREDSKMHQMNTSLKEKTTNLKEEWEEVGDEEMQVASLGSKDKVQKLLNLMIR